MAMREYADDWPPCRHTYATLTISSKGLAPTLISELLWLKPMSGHKVGDLSSRGVTETKNVWKITSRNNVDSRDCRRHIDWLLDQLDGKEMELRELQEKGAVITVVCYWESATGMGGPILGVNQMARLVHMSIDLGWDIRIQK
jgi:hypothetical protein